MMWIESFFLYALNLAFATLLCTSMSLAAAKLYVSLPKRHASLVIGLSMCLVAPALVGVGGLFSVGILPTLASSDATPTAQVATSRITQPQAITIPEDSVDRGEAAPISGRSLREFPVAATPTMGAKQTADRETPTPENTLVHSTATLNHQAGLSRTLIAVPIVLMWFVGIIVLTVYRVRDWRLCMLQLRDSSPNVCLVTKKAFGQALSQHRLRRTPRLLVSSAVLAPVVVGSCRPAVIVPNDLSNNFTMNQMRSVLAHELSHIARRDHWVVGIQVLATTLFWWNPFVWLVSRKVALLRELICDDMVLRHEQAPREYAESIIAMAEKSAVLAPLGISLSSVSELEQRIRRIVSQRVPGLETRLGRWATVGVLLFALTLTTGVILAQVPSPSGQQSSASGGSDVATASEPPEFGKDEFPLNSISGTVFLANGQPAVNARLRIVGNRLSEIDGRLKADSQGRFEFCVRFKTEALGQLQFWAEATDNSQRAYHRFEFKPEDLVTDGIRINLQPTRDAEIEVVDGEGKPIAGARVAVRLEYPNILYGSKTDALGKAAVNMPADERIETLMAWKDHAGLDYKLYKLNRYDKADIQAVPPEFPSDRPERLVLDGAQPITVTIVDGADGTPIDGADVYPWTLRKDQATDSLNLFFFAEHIAQTASKSGTTTFDWMPAWHKTPLTFWPNADGYERPRGNYDPSKDAGALTLTLNRLVSIRGTVFDTDGQPAEGVEVSARGEGRSMNSFSATTRSASDGTYKLELAPLHNYLLTASNDSQVSTPHTGLIVYANKPLENRNFKLRSPTLVHGRLLNERTMDPIPNERVIVYQYGTELMEIPDTNIPNPDNERSSVRPIVQHYATTDAGGNFEFKLGDGSFDLRPPQREKVEKFEISGQDELEFTITTKVHSEVELVGFVLAKTDSQPIKDALLEGVPRNYTSMQWTATADDEGKFKVLRRPEPTYVLAKNKEETLASIVEVEELDRSFVIHLEPVGAASGRLIDRAGQPIALQRINYAVDLPCMNEGEMMPRFGGKVTTNELGEFRLDSLASNWEYRLSLPETPGGTIPRLTTLTVKAGESLELGDLTEPEPYAPFVQKTLKERIQTAFDVEGTPVDRHQRALKKIELLNNNLLIVFGEPSDPRIHRLMEIRFEDADFRIYRDDYRFMAIPTDVERIAAAGSLAKSLGEDLNESRQSFYLVLIDSEGKTIATVSDADLCVAGELSKDKLFELLQRHATQPLDAQQLLDEALRRAAKENKRVLVQETATWCGPCHLLSGFLDANRTWEKDFIWVKMDHRWTGAKDIMEELRDGAEGGIPWFVVLDAQGEKLATSNDPNTGKNIGFPSSPGGRKHLANILNATCQRMTEAEVQSLVDAIDEPK